MQLRPFGKSCFAIAVALAAAALAGAGAQRPPAASQPALTQLAASQPPAIKAPAKLPEAYTGVDVAGLVQRFAENFKENLDTMEYSFAPAAEERMPPVLLVHARVKREGFFVIHYSSDDPPAGLAIGRANPDKVEHRQIEYYVLVQKAGVLRTVTAPSRPFVGGFLVNAGDTLLVPLLLSQQSKNITFATAGMGRYPGTLEKFLQDKAAAHADLMKKIDQPAKDKPPVDNQLAAMLSYDAASTSASQHEMAGSATASCALFLTARQPGDFNMKAVLPDRERTAMHVTIVPADSAITVLLGSFHRESETRSLAQPDKTINTSIETAEVRLSPENASLPNPFTLRVGDILGFEAWSQVIHYDKTIPPIVPPPISLQKVSQPERQ